jgi:recombination protein RecT
METLKDFKKQLEKYTPLIQESCSKHKLDTNKFIFYTIDAVKKRPELLKCTETSLFGSILFFADCGLTFDDHLGLGYILIETKKGKSEAIPFVGYKGLIEIAYRDMKVNFIRIQAVYDKDLFDYSYGTNEYLTHTSTNPHKGNLTHVYAMCNIEGLQPQFVVLKKKEVVEIIKKGKSFNNNLFDPFDIMSSKVALKLLFKTLPKIENDTLLYLMDLDNKIEYQNARIKASKIGWVVEEEVAPKSSAMESKDIPELDIKVSDKLKSKLKTK